MKQIIRDATRLIVFMLIVWAALFIVIGLIRAPASGAVDPVTYSKLRSELYQEIFKLEKRVKELEGRFPTKDGEFPVYHVDSVAGTIECRSCRFLDKKP